MNKILLCLILTQVVFGSEDNVIKQLTRYANVIEEKFNYTNPNGCIHKIENDNNYTTCVDQVKQKWNTVDKQIISTDEMTCCLGIDIMKCRQTAVQVCTTIQKFEYGIIEPLLWDLLVNCSHYRENATRCNLLGDNFKDTVEDNSKLCPPDWQYLNGRCLIVKTIAVSFNGAKQTCSSYGGVLASLHSTDEAKEILAKHEETVLHLGTWVATGIMGDAYVNLDGTVTDWINIHWEFMENSRKLIGDTNRRESWGPYLVIMAHKTSKNNIVVKHYPVPSDFISSGFICQKPTHKWNQTQVVHNIQSNENDTFELNHLQQIKNELSDLKNYLQSEFTTIKTQLALIAGGRVPSISANSTEASN